MPTAGGAGVAGGRRAVTTGRPIGPAGGRIAASLRVPEPRRQPRISPSARRSAAATAASTGKANHDRRSRHAGTAVASPPRMPLPVGLVACLVRLVGEPKYRIGLLSLATFAALC